MTKALKITSITVAAAAVLLIALPAVFSSGIDEQAQTLLDSPSVLENLKKTASLANTGTVSPLVQQAQDFAKYLNPPPPPKKSRSTPARNKKPSIRPQAPVSAKFDLLGTSYYALRPDLSLALIDEPGKGLRWIRQSSEIGHLIVEEVKDGKVVIRDGTSTYELEAKRAPKRSLLKGESSYSAESPPSDSLRTTAPLSSSTPESPLRLRRPARKITTRSNRTTVNPPKIQQTHQFNEDVNTPEAAIFEQFTKETEGIEDPNEWLKKADELMERLANSSQEVTDEEAVLLDELGRELEDTNEISPRRDAEIEPETDSD